VRGSLLARLFLPGRRIRLRWALVFDKDSNSWSPAIAGVWVVVPPRLYDLPMVGMVWEGGDGGRGDQSLHAWVV
jgi:hypothetical protein